MNIGEIVNNKEWQDLRISFLGTWKKTPELNVLRLRTYLENMTCPYKLRRVHNYLTGSGFRLGIIKNKEIDNLLVEIRNIRYK